MSENTFLVSTIGLRLDDFVNNLAEETLQDMSIAFLQEVGVTLGSNEFKADRTQPGYMPAPREGLIAYVNSDHEYCLVPYTAGALAAIRNLDYEELPDLAIPDEQTRTELSTNRDHVKLNLFSYETQEDIMFVVPRIVEAKGLTPLDGTEAQPGKKGDWLPLSGLKVTDYSGAEPVTVTIKELPYEVGTYAYNNGVVAFVDRQARLCVAPHTDEFERMLKRNGYGYTQSQLDVPLSNREIIGENIAPGKNEQSESIANQTTAEDETYKQWRKTWELMVNPNQGQIR